MKKFLILFLLVCGTVYAGESKANKIWSALNQSMIMFYMEGCPHCKKMEAVVSEFEKTDGVSVKIIKDNNIAKKFGVQSFPTFIITNGGKIVGKSVGEMKIGNLELFWREPTIQPDRPRPQQQKPPVNHHGIFWNLLLINFFLFLITVRIWAK